MPFEPEQSAEPSIYRRSLRTAAAPLGFIAILSSQAALTAPPANSLQAAIDQARRDDPSIPGIIAAVDAPSLGIRWRGASGTTALHGTQVLKPDQPFRIASITKPFTAAAVFRLIEAKRMRLDDPIAKLVSGTTARLLEQGGYDPRLIRVEDLLAHTSGLYDYATDDHFAEAVFSAPDHRWTRAEQIHFAMKYGKPAGAPGAVYAYSDTGYVILGEIVERLTGRPLGAAIAEIAGKLPGTHFERSGTSNERALLAHSYFGDIDMLRIDPSFDLYGGGGLISTASDLNAFFRALVRGDYFKKKATLAAALAVPQVERAKGEQLHAPLLALIRFGRRTCWGHQGFWGSVSLYCPDDDIAVTISINQAQTKPGTLINLVRRVAAIVDEEEARRR